MTDEEREAKKVLAIELLKSLKDCIATIDEGIPNLCQQILEGEKHINDLIGVVREEDLLTRTHNIALDQFEEIIYPPTVANNQQLFFEALGEIQQQKTVTALDIEWLEKLSITSAQLTQDALLDLKQRTAH